MVVAVAVLQVILSGSFARALREAPVLEHPFVPPSAIVGLHEEPPGDSAPPPCIGDFCQPRVAIPGWKPNIDPRSGSNGLLIVVAERLPLGPVSTVARVAGIAGLRVEYRPPQVGLLPGDPARGGRFMVGLRWRLDAWSGPNWVRFLAADPDSP
jgi:hypothetical protein